MKIAKKSNAKTQILQKDSAGGKKLREKSLPIKKEEIGTKKVSDIIQQMKSVLANEPDGVALAGPQIGISKRIFILNPIVYRSFEDSQNPNGISPDLKSGPMETVFINPEIIKISKDRKKVAEGCLSVRPWYGKVKRASRATVSATNEKGEDFTIDASGLLAQIFQHEIEHFDGILFVDKATDLYKLTDLE